MGCRARWVGVAVALTAGVGMAAPPPQRFGTDPNTHYLPETAIEAPRPPNIVLRAGDRDTDPLPYYRIGPDTYLFYGNIAEVDPYNRGFNGNAGFVVTPAGVVAIDALGSPKLGRRMIATIRSVTDRPIRYLIITHHHPDHAYGAIAFRRLGGVKILAHEGMLDYIHSERLERSVAYRRRFIAADMAGFEPVTPDVTLGGEVYSRYGFTLGGRRFHVYNVNHHHSSGDVVVHQVDDGIVWISDLAFNQRVTYMGDGDSRAAIEAQDWLLATFREARLMVPGHGAAQRPPFPMVRRTQAYMKRLRAVMAKAVEEGVGLQDAIARADFPDWKDVRLYGLNHRLNAHFVYLEMEQALF